MIKRIFVALSYTEVWCLPWQWEQVLLLRHPGALWFYPVHLKYSFFLRVSDWVDCMISLALCPDISQKIETQVLELSFVWYSISSFSALSLESCTTFGLLSIRVRIASTNFGKSHCCKCSSKLTRSSLILSNLFWVNLIYPFKSFSLATHSIKCFNRYC